MAAKWRKKNNQKKAGSVSTRDNAADNLNYRTLSLRLDSAGVPATLDIEKRSVEVVGASQAPVQVYDYNRGDVVDEVLLMAGVELPTSRQVVLLDTHDRWSGTSAVLGSYRDIKPEGEQLIGRACFSTVPEAEGPWTKIREGHLTDFSVGYRVVNSEWIPAGETRKIKGNSFEGPVSIVTRWRLKELSACPIGADELAKARSKTPETPKEPAREIPPEPKPEPKIETKGQSKMNKKFFAMLVARGLDKDATEEQAWAFFELLEARGELFNPSKIADKAKQDERERRSEIRSMCSDMGFEDEAQRMLDEDMTVDQARAELFKLLKKGKEADPVRAAAAIIADERDKFRDAAGHSVLMRAGVDIAKPAEGAEELRDFTMVELCREALRLAGKPYKGDRREIVGRALTTSDLPAILANVANKQLLAGFEEANETFEVWTDTGSVPDFKAMTLARASEADDLDEIAERGAYEYGDLSDKKETVQAVTFGKITAITRQAIINDDLGAITMVPRKMGRAAKRKIGDCVYSVLTANAAMGDGVTLFHDATHGNVGTSAVIGISPVAEAIRLMGLQTDPSGNAYLNIRPEYFIGPKTIEGVSEVFFRSEKFADKDSLATDSYLAASRVNPYSGDYFTRVYDARLDGSDTAKYYFAGPRGMTVTVFYLNGQKEPYMEQREGWTVDGTEFKVRIDAAAKAVDWVALVSNAGG
jgi:hypothetical protein